jgi:serine/threonine protein kinase
MSGEVTPVRSVSTPSSISNETKYPAALEELFNNLDLVPGSGVEVTARELISQGELGTLPEQEALDIVRNMVEDGLLNVENSLDVFRNILSISRNKDVRLDTLITLPLDEASIRNTINLLPTTVIDVLAEGDIRLDSLVIPRREFLGYIELTNEGIELDYINGKVNVVMPEQVARINLPRDERLSELRYIGEGQYGTTYYDEATGTIAKYQKGSGNRGLSPDEVEFQRKAAAQGIAPFVFEDINIDAVGRNFKQQFLDGYVRLDDVIGYPPKPLDPGIELKVYELLDKLHANGVVHNDLHGANIMVRLPTATEPLDVKLIDFGLAGDMDSRRLRDSLTDYGYVSESEFNRSVVYHGTHHTSVIPGDDVFSLSNEFGPALYTNIGVAPTVNHAKALPSQDVVTTGSRTPRRESIGNVQSIILEYTSGDLNELPDALYYRDEIQRSMSAALKAAGEDRLRKNFNAWIKINNNPADWWHYLRERYTDDRLSDLAKLQLDISDRLIFEGVRAFKGVNPGDYVIIDPSLIIHRSVPHAVDSTGTLAEGLAYRNAIDELLNANLNNKTTQAIVAHNRLNMDTYIQNQLTAAISQQEKETIQAIQQHYADGTLADASFINRRSTSRAQWIDDLERQQNRTLSKFMEGLNDVCL